MANIYIQPDGVISVTSGLAQSAALTDAASAATQVALTAISPLAAVATGLSGTVQSCQAAIADVRAGVDRLCQVSNGCAQLYQDCEQGVFQLWGGAGQLFSPAPTGGAWSIVRQNLGGAVQQAWGQICSWAGKVNWGAVAVEVGWTVADIAGMVAGVSGAIALAPFCPAVAAALGVLAVGYGLNNVAGDLVNAASLLQLKPNPHYNWFKSTLEGSPLGKTGGDALYYIGDLAPIVLGGVGAYKLAASKAAQGAEALSSSDAARMAGDALGSAEDQVRSVVDPVEQGLKKSWDKLWDKARKTFEKDQSRSVTNDDSFMGQPLVQNAY